MEMPSQAQIKVFSTPELLEKILLYLPLPSLLFVQGVSQTWKNTILASPKLQQALFLQPLPSSTVPIFNPLLRALFPPLFGPSTPLEELPDLKEALQSLSWYQMASGGDNSLDTVLRKEASWRRMYPVQPPAMISKVEVTSSCGCAWLHYEAGFKGDKDTQRMGSLYDVIIHLMDSFGSEFLGVRWRMFKHDGEETERQNDYWQKQVLRNDIEVVRFHYTDCYVASFKHVKPSGFKSDGDEFETGDLVWSEKPDGYDGNESLFTQIAQMEKQKAS